MLHSTHRKQVFWGIKIETLENIIIKRFFNRLYIDEKLSLNEDFARNEFTILSELNEKTNLTEKALDLIIDADDTYLIVEDIPGEVIDKLSYEEQQPLAKIIYTYLQEIHSHGFIHCDFKPSNVIRTQDGIRVIDWECGRKICSLADNQLGTYGYTIDKKKHTNNTILQDYYSFAAYLVSIALKCDVSRLPDNVAFLSYSLSSLNYRQLEKLIIKMKSIEYEYEFDHHSFDIEIAQCLEELEINYSKINQINYSITARKLGEVDDKNLFKDTIDFFSDFQYEENCKIFWNNNHMFPANLLEGINIGSAGIIIGMISLEYLSGNIGLFNQLIQRSALGLCQIQTPLKSNGLMTGNAGVALALACCYKKFNNEKFLTEAKKRLNIAVGAFDEPDFFCGVAGIAYAGMLIAEILNDNLFLKLIEPCIEWLVLNYKESEGSLYWQSNENTENNIPTYTGFAHGAIGISFVLEKYNELYPNKNLTRITDTNAF